MLVKKLKALNSMDTLYMQTQPKGGKLSWSMF